MGSVLPFVPLLLVGHGLLLHIVGLATKDWFTVEIVVGLKTTFGLWQTCVRSVCVDNTDKEGFEDWIRVCQAMAILGMLAGLAAAGASAAIAFFKYSTRYPGTDLLMYSGRDLPSVVGPAATVFGVLAFAFVSICSIVFSEKLDDHYVDEVDVEQGYSVALSSTGGSLMLIGGIVAFFAARN